MSLSYLDAFAYSEQEKLLVEPIFTSDLKCGHFEPMGQDFINWLLHVLNIKEVGEQYPNLRKKLDRYVNLFNNKLHIDYRYFLMEINDINLSNNEELKKEFFKLVSGMEKSLNYNTIRGKVRRILGIRNGVDFARYTKGISGVSEDTPVNGLLRFWKKEIDGDDTKTLGEELKGDIELMSKRISELLGKDTIKDGVIIDDNIGLFSALDGYRGGEIYLTVDGKVIDAKPPKGEWLDEDYGNESKKIVFEVGGDIIPF